MTATRYFLLVWFLLSIVMTILLILLGIALVDKEMTLNIIFKHYVVGSVLGLVAAPFAVFSRWGFSSMEKDTSIEGKLFFSYYKYRLYLIGISMTIGLLFLYINYFTQ